MFHKTPPMHFEKLASSVQLPEDPNSWTQEIHQELYKQVAYISDFDAHIVMSKVDAEQGHGFGHIEVTPKTSLPLDGSQKKLEDAGVNIARIPIIIANRQLKPLDMLILADSSMAPLTENRLRKALFRPQVFDMAAKSPGDVSIMGSLFPPYRHNHMLGGMGSVGTNSMGKFGSSSTAPLLPQILRTIHAEDFNKFASALCRNGLANAYDMNPATFEATQTLSSYKGQSEVSDSIDWNYKTASVVQISKQDGMYRVKMASNKCWQPHTTVMSRGELYKLAGDDIAKKVDVHGSVTLGNDSVEQPADDKTDYQMVDKSGIWKVQTTAGVELVGYCFTNLLDTTGTPIPITVFTNGSASAIQGEIAGSPVTSGANLTTGAPVGYGFWAHHLPNGSVEATIPMQLGAKITDERGTGFMAETYDTKKVIVRVQPHIRQVVGIGDTMIIPESFVWVPLAGQSVVLVSNPAELGKTKTAQASALRMLGEVTLRGSGTSFSLEGYSVEKLAYDQKNNLNIDDTMFLLTGLGAKPEDAYAKMAAATYYQRPEQVHVKVGFRTDNDAWRDGVAKTAELLSKFPIKPVELWKEAAMIPDPMAVDTVLSLGFINSENVAAFVESLPILDKAQSRLVDLLMGVRLGLRDVPEGALERAIKNCEEVIEGLKVIAFSQN